MSIKLMTLVWDFHGDLSASETSLLLKLADYAADNGTQIFPSFSDLSSKTKLSKSTVIRTIDSLVKKGFLKKEGQLRPNGSATSNQYVINIEMLSMTMVTETIAPQCHHETDNTSSVTMTPEMGGGSVTMTLPSVTMTPGVVSPRHPLIRHSDPSCNHMHMQFDENDASDPLTETKPNPKSRVKRPIDELSEEVDMQGELARKLKREGIHDSVIKKMISMHGMDRVAHALGCIQEDPTIQNVGATLNARIIHGVKPNQTAYQASLSQSRGQRTTEPQSNPRGDYKARPEEVDHVYGVRTHSQAYKLYEPDAMPIESDNVYRPDFGSIRKKLKG